MAGQPRHVRRAISRMRSAPHPYSGSRTITTARFRIVKSPRRNSAPTGASTASRTAGAIRESVFIISPVKALQSQNLQSRQMLRWGKGPTHGARVDTDVYTPLTHERPTQRPSPGEEDAMKINALLGVLVSTLPFVPVA